MLQVGVGYLPSQHDQILQNLDWINFVELEPEGWIRNPEHRERIDQIAGLVPVSIHGTQLNLSGQDSLVQEALEWRDLVERLPNFLFLSDHFSFFSQGSELCDLYLPPQFNEEGLDLLLKNTLEFANITGHPLHLENIPNFLASHFRWDIQKKQFFEFLKRSNAKMILNIQSILMEAIWRDYSPLKLLEEYLSNTHAKALTFVPPESMNPGLYHEFSNHLDHGAIDLTKKALKLTQANYLLIQTRYGSENLSDLKNLASQIQQGVC